VSCRAVGEALLAALVQLQAGAAFQPGVIPAQAAAASNSTSSPATASQSATPSTAPAAATSSTALGLLEVPASGTAAAAAPVTSRSTGSAATDFSLGSDAVSGSWHAGGPVDVASLTKLVQLVLKVLQRVERWHSAMSIGECSTVTAINGSKATLTVHARSAIAVLCKDLLTGIPLPVGLFSCQTPATEQSTSSTQCISRHPLVRSHHVKQQESADVLTAAALDESRAMCCSAL
jgi:hypothetical protein